MSGDGFLAQVRRNSVALISLAVALTSLGYNTWRNEQTEANRNVRAAGFRLMSELAELQQVVFLAHYDMDELGGNPRVGWTHVLAIRDLSYPMPAAVGTAAGELHRAWEANWQDIDQQANFAEVDQAIDQAKQEILTAIKALD